MTEVFENRRVVLSESQSTSEPVKLSALPDDRLNAYDIPPEPRSRIEMVLEYGHLHRDVNILTRELGRNQIASEAIVLTVILLLVPLLIMKLIMIAIPACMDAALWPLLASMGLPMLHATIQTTINRACEGIGLFSFLVIYLVLSFSLMTRVPFKSLFGPTNLVITREGIAKQWMGLLSIRSKVYKWEAITSAIVREDQIKGRRERKLELKFGPKDKVVVDLHSIRTATELQIIKVALDKFVPDQIVSDHLKLIVFNSQAVGTRYTEIWSQALLGQKKRKWTQALPPGTKMNDDRLEIVRKIGSGGQGTVYLAKRNDLANAPMVVLKEYILPESSEAHDRRRALKSFEQEIALLGRISNERIVSLLDVFVQDQRAYLVLEYVDGPSLKQLVQSKGRLEPHECLQLAIQMCEILECLHSQDPQIIHQDFTPDNLLLGTDNRLKLVDFNVTREELQIRTSLVVGKQAYMPPEQFKGKSTTQSDIYAMGGTLFFILTGKEPEALSVCHPGKLLSDLDSDIDRLVARATKLELDQRFSSVEQIKEELIGLTTRISKDENILQNDRV